MSYIVYGIKNCDTVKKSLTWLKNKNIPFGFHDYKTQGVSTDKLKEWCKQKSWESLVNKKGTTWRQLDDSIKNKITDEASAILLMKDKTSLIKRPLIEHQGKIVALGFDEEQYQQLLK
ncbi:MAG TPA: ArsC family reductase [Cytophagaceae bacterium]|jgi:arsenate reductase|nr:ArsC family reductase [Cytophagaceae bacterium]